MRGLLKSPGYTIVAVLTLAIGIGGSVAVFTLLDRVVLDPLAYPEADRLVRLRNQVPGVGPDTEWQMASAQYFYYKENATSIEEIGAFQQSGTNLRTPSGPQRRLNESTQLHCFTSRPGGRRLSPRRRGASGELVARSPCGSN